MKRNISSWIEWLISVLYCLILLLPFSRVYMPYETEPKWENDYLFSSTEGVIFLTLLVLPWVLFKWQKGTRLGVVMKVVAIIMSALGFLYVCLHFVMYVPDFLPGTGMYLLFLLLPLMILMIVFQVWERRMKIKTTHEDILDTDDLG